MTAPFDDCRIVREVREHCAGGWGIFVEFVKFAIIINIAGKITKPGRLCERPAHGAI